MGSAGHRQAPGRAGRFPGGEGNALAELCELASAG
jgi:hypothetical protein